MPHRAEETRAQSYGEKAGIKYLLASTPELSATAVVQRYRSRWIIETLFQDLKQHCGFSHYQGRSLEVLIAISPSASLPLLCLMC